MEKNPKYLLSLELNKRANSVKTRTGMHIDSAYSLVCKELCLPVNFDLVTIEQAKKVLKLLSK